jgi:hypothetical protein
LLRIQNLLNPGLSTADQITLDRKQLEGLLFEVVQARKTKYRPDNYEETEASRTEVELGFKATSEGGK